MKSLYEDPFSAGAVEPLLPDQSPTTGLEAGSNCSSRIDVSACARCADLKSVCESSF